MTKKTLIVAGIHHGTVIDHIVQGRGIQLLHLLDLTHYTKMIATGFNLPSENMGSKDLIKIEGKELTVDEASSVAIISPKATINIIRNYKVIKKLDVKVPHTIEALFACPNSRCITNFENMKSFFFVIHPKVCAHLTNCAQLKCKYCEKLISQDEIKTFRTR